MKIKMVDVAKHLGVSKATVSLVVNNKPGVSEETRKKVLQCIDEMKQSAGKKIEKNAEQISKQTKFIKVVIINHDKKVVCDPELDLWTEVLTTFDTQARKMGYMYSLTYVGNEIKEREEVIKECNLPIVAGVIIFGTEMDEMDSEMIQLVNKPVVLYDYDMEDGAYSSVCIDNAGAVRNALHYCRDQGAKKIYYFATNKNIYNFKRRREAYLNTLIGWEQFPQKSDILSLGNTIPEITKNAEEWFSEHRLPDAIVMENYQVTIGVTAAMRKKGIGFSDEIQLVGIDEVPEYMTSGIPVLQMKVPHAERAAATMMLLHKMILGEWNVKVKILAESEMISH